MTKIMTAVTMILVAGTSAFMSVYGLTTVFPGETALIIMMGIGLELGKLVTTHHLVQNWAQVNGMQKVVYVAVVAVLVMLTSAEIFGFLTRNHIETGNALKASRLEISRLADELEVLKARQQMLTVEHLSLSEQIQTADNVIAQMPANYIRSRKQYLEQCGYAGKQARVTVISENLMALAERQTAISVETRRMQAAQIDERHTAGAVFAIAELTGWDESLIAKLFILALTLILEPLSVGLVIAASVQWKTESEPETDTPEPQREKTEKPETPLEEFHRICRDSNLTFRDVARITGRKREETVQAWANTQTPLPKDILSKLRKAA